MTAHREDGRTALHCDACGGLWHVGKADFDALGRFLFFHRECPAFQATAGDSVRWRGIPGQGQ